MDEGRMKELFLNIDRLGNKIKDDWHFYPETNIYMTDNINFPCVTYKLSNREPFRFSGHKPKYKEQVDNPNNKDLRLTRFSQMFEIKIEFGVWGKTRESTDDYRDWFEKFIINHGKDFKADGGIIEIVFKQQAEDQVKEVNDNYYIKMPLLYYIKNERVHETSVEKVGDIQTLSQNGDKYDEIKAKLLRQ